MSDLMILALIFFLLLSLVVTIVGFLLYSGLLSEVDIRTGSPPIKNVTIAYKYKVGSYRDCGSIFTESCSIGPKLYCIGVYYDDPNAVPVGKCRYAVGSVLSEGEEKPEEELVQLYKKFGFSVFSFPEVTHAVTSHFPNRTSLSFMLGLYKVLPVLFNYIKERKLCAHPFLEIYKGDLIHYMFPLSRQIDFYVPEASEKEKKEESEEDRQTGCDSNSETSSVSRTLMSESRETSLAPSSVPSLPEQEDLRDGDAHSEHSDRSESEGSASSFEELDLEPGRGLEEEDCLQAKDAAVVNPDLLPEKRAAAGEGEE